MHVKKLRRAVEETHPELARVLQAYKMDGTVSANWVGLAQLTFDKDLDSKILCSHAAVAANKVDIGAVPV